ncbi:MAG: hypothetical protein M3299_07775, partial [Thermoproteota archaeon]|nr:hypothetical protein [Thermoproteota archaeon]
VFLVPDRDRAEFLSYKGIRTITLRYPTGSLLAQEFNGKNSYIQLTLNGTSDQQLQQNNNNNNGSSTGMGQVISAINKALLEAQSPAQISDSELLYSGEIKGGPTGMTLSYTVEIKPTLERFILQRNSEVSNDRSSISRGEAW